MIKNSSKINPESNNWNRPYLIKKLEEDFVKFIPYSNQKKEMIKNAEKIDWSRIVHLFELEINDLVKELEIPESKGLAGWFSSFIEFAILKFLNHQLYYVFFFHLSKVKKADKNSRKEKIINSLMRQTKSDIKNTMGLFKLQLEISNLKWMDSETMQSKIIELQKKHSKRFGQKYTEEKLKLYGKILKENDEFIKKGGDGNYREATRMVAKKYSQNFKNLYKSFIKFKNTKHILTYEDFKNSIYYR